MAHLVFQTAFPGDLFLSIPLLKQIKDWEPAARIVLACRPGLGEFFIKNGLADEIVEVNKRAADKGASSLRRLKGEEWDIIFSPHESVRTAFWVWQLKAKEKVGFRKWWNGLVFSKRVVKPREYPDALRQLSLLTPVDQRLAEKFGELAGLKSLLTQNPVEDFRAQIIPEWASMQINPARPRGKIAFLAPGSVWATKRWTRRGYTELARRLLNEGFAVELVGSPAEKEFCAGIAAQVPGVINRAGETNLNGLAEKFTEGSVLVCNDSGAMHAAASSGLPTVAIFGPTTLALGFRPWQERALVVQRPLSCRPCGKHGGNVCPIGTHECMEKITADDVLRAVRQLL